jgi:5-methylcytosine-specific restriction endonuclease McrA
MTTLLCLNCDRPLDGSRKPLLFCSERCAEEAHTIRYVRRVVADGRILDPEVAEAVKIRVGMVLGGGYAKSERKLSVELREMIFARDGACQICGGEATQIHHVNEDHERIARDINDPANLQAICDPCHRRTTLSTFRVLRPEEEAGAARLRERIESLHPLRQCDDDQNWASSWRAVARKRAALIEP